MSRRDKKLSEATTAYYRMVLRHYLCSTNETRFTEHGYKAFGDKPMREITEADVKALDAAMTKAGKSDGTIRKVLATIRAMLNAAVKDGLLTVNPAAKIDLPGDTSEEIRPLSVEELDRLVAALKTRRDQVLVSLLASTGMRFGEAAYLRRAHIDLVRGEIHVQGSATEVRGGMVEGKTKTKTRRVIPLDPDMLQTLASFVDGMSPETHVFAGPDHGILRVRNWRKRV